MMNLPRNHYSCSCLSSFGKCFQFIRCFWKNVYVKCIVSLFMVNVTKFQENIKSTKTTAKPTQQNHKWEKERKKKFVEKERKMEWHAIHSTSENILLFTSLRQKRTTTMTKKINKYFSLHSGEINTINLCCRTRCNTFSLKFSRLHSNFCIAIVLLLLHAYRPNDFCPAFGADQEITKYLSM